MQSSSIQTGCVWLAIVLDTDITTSKLRERGREGESKVVRGREQGSERERERVGGGAAQ
jgi:hypothetical protein